MSNGVSKNPNGPFWQLGNIVTTAGTPVSIMSLVDSGNLNAPQTATPGTAGAGEYTVRCNQVIVQGMKSNGGNGLTNNTGNIYVIQKSSTGSNNRTDLGCIILTIPAGTTGVIGSPSQETLKFSPYLLWVDSDNTGDGAQITLII
jgi:hypothetical protein